MGQLQWWQARFKERWCLGVRLALLLIGCGSIILRGFDSSVLAAEPEGMAVQSDGPVLVTEINGGIFPGTQRHIEDLIKVAESYAAPLVIIKLSTPGGILSTTQLIVESFFRSRVPIVVYVAPSGGTATSAGVFIFVAAHVAAMAPGTSLGAAHPVGGSGENIEGDLREKAVNMASALVRSVAEQRGRNTAWVEQAVRESKTLTDKEAVAAKVADLIATDIPELLRMIVGKKVVVNGHETSIGDLTGRPVRLIDMSWKNRAINTLADPNVAAILWLVASIGITAELYHPGLIVPGVVGVICLVLGLLVGQVIPLSVAGIALLGLGTVMLFAEAYLPSGILGLGGIVAIVIGLLSLVDVEVAPDLSVQYSLIVPVAAVLISCMMFVMFKLREALRAPLSTGEALLNGREGEVSQSFVRLGEGSYEGRVSVAGENWRARAKVPLSQGDRVKVCGMVTGLVIEVVRS